MSMPGPGAKVLGKLGYELALLQPFIPTYMHLIASALFPIYTGAHASLFRPSSAAEPQKRAVNVDKAFDNEDEDDEEEEEALSQKMEGLAPGDAILFPLLAGGTLTGLYFLIKWLQDPALLNRILNWYFSTFGIFAVSKLISDSLTVATSFIFPSRWRRRGTEWHVKSNRRVMVTRKDGGQDSSKTNHRLLPLPGWLSTLKVSSGIFAQIWNARTLFTERWTIKVLLHRAIAFKAKFGIQEVTGFVFGLVAVAYFNLVDKPWWLTNILGFSFSYGALQFMSPTTFWTGTLVLGALFVYDVYFVFFTPLMVTVATSLDIPIKLLFPRPAGPDADPSKPSLAMLGLGDVVLPGIMIGLALRFDLYMFYLRKQTQKVSNDDVRADTNLTTGKEQVSAEVVKAKYHSAAGGWGERFWSGSLLARSEENDREGGMFPKPYFHASLLGYVTGMLATLGCMQIWGHAQPALLYLVPGVLGSLWGTALLRGEWKEMWNFTEAAEEDTKPKGKAQNEEAAEKEIKGKDVNVRNPQDEKQMNGQKVQGVSTTGKSSNDRNGHREIFTLSITAPSSPKATQETSPEEATHNEHRHDSSKTTESTKHENESSQGSGQQNAESESRTAPASPKRTGMRLRSSAERSEEPAEKRRRHE
ncbi:MAG: hypothetical protein M1827_001143 [Pycnora praestabilis]|nr:MAG: hypothetical protein M1827_001143 [Pycnora praestabilis]